VHLYINAGPALGGGHVRHHVKGNGGPETCTEYMEDLGVDGRKYSNEGVKFMDRLGWLRKWFCGRLF